MRPALSLFVLFGIATTAFAQTTAGTSAIIVVPVIAQTSSFGSEVTVYNPNAATITVNPVFYDAQNTSSPGAKACTSLSVAANVSKAFTVSSQCALPSGSNFGLLVLSESTGTNRFYGYARTQTPQGIGFSTEGFPIENFNDQLQHATGLKRVAASGGLPAYQTNCFVATLGDAVNYELRLFEGATHTQIGSTLSGSLAAFQQFRYLDVFAAAGVGAGNKTNVRAQFTNLTGNKKKLIGFCTVQENTNFSADFRIAKSYGGTPQNAFVQSGNAFGTAALIGTNDVQPLSVLVNGATVMRFVPGTIDTNAPVASPNLVGGFAANTAGAFSGQTVAGGGKSGNACYEPVTNTDSRTCANQATNDFASVSGGYGNLASGLNSAVAGGAENTASGESTVVGGGIMNFASGLWATVAGGYQNVAEAELATVGGGDSNVASFGATVAGGDGNSASNFYASITGGQHNVASSAYATVAGGSQNTASGFESIVAGGTLNVASGERSFAAGHDVLADEPECAVFGFFSSGPANCKGVGNIIRLMGNHGFSVDWGPATGNGGGTWWVEINDITPCRPINTYTNAYLSCSGVWTSNSDRSKKENFAAIDPLSVLKKVVALPVTHWNYKAEPGVLRIGPMAQDFYAAFGVGQDNLTIAQTDEAGVAFAAIQGLNQLVEEKDMKIEAQQRSINEQERHIEVMQKELDALKRAVAQLTHSNAAVAAEGTH